MFPTLLLKWASAPGRAYVSVDLARITTSAVPIRRDRVLNRNELTALLPALLRSERPYAAALKFMLLTLCRREEVCGARWRDIDLDAATLTIPAERSKNGQPHVVPLSRQAAHLLRARYPAIADDDATQADAFVFATFTGSAIGNWDRENKRLIVASGLGIEDPKTGVVTMKDRSPLWTSAMTAAHCATMLGEMGELPRYHRGSNSITPRSDRRSQPLTIDRDTARRSQGRCNAS